MQKSSYQGTDSYPSTYQFEFDHTYISKIEAEANRLRALAISNFFAEVASNVSALFSGTVNWFANEIYEIKRNRLRNELHGFNDHMLSDIGITRGGIEGIVNGTIKSVRHQPIPGNTEPLKQPKVAAVVQKHQDDTPIAA